MQSRIQNLVVTQLRPTFIEVINESSRHTRGTDSHFKVIVVSSMFDGKPVLERHRMVNDAVKEVFQDIHALSVVAKTPSQWTESQVVVSSPPCLGGSKHDQQQQHKS